MLRAEFFTNIVARCPVAGKRPEIERGPLRDILLDSLQPGTVQWNCKLESAEMQGEQVQLRFADGEARQADIVVVQRRRQFSFARARHSGPARVCRRISQLSVSSPQPMQTIPKLWDLLGGSALIALGG